MIKIKTYQDFLAIGEDEKERMAFIQNAITEYKSSEQYQTAVNAQMYYDGENPTINQYEKILYDLQGKAHVDMWTANHKIASSFFTFAVDQENGYLLGNGVTFKKNSGDKLGTKRYPFDQQILRAGRAALIGGISYGFWNLDHVDVFTAQEFVPLYDEENGSLSAGIRFWQIVDDKPLRATLYELDGYTDYIKRKGEDMTVMTDKRAYTRIVARSEVDGEMIYDGANYPSFPIVPFKNNDSCKSELCGKRNTIDALDIACSGMVNNCDEGSLIYWVLQNAGGMDDIDDQKFLEHIKTAHVVHTEDGVTAEPHTVEAPFDGNQTTIDMLNRKLFTDFQCFDSSAVSAGNQTATAINASYVPLDLKVDKFETNATEFANGIMALAGVDDDATYTRNKLINKQEEVQTVLMAAQYLDEEYITTKVLTILGDADMADDILKRKEAEDLDRFNGETEETVEETVIEDVET